MTRSHVSYPVVQAVGSAVLADCNLYFVLCVYVYMCVYECMCVYAVMVCVCSTVPIGTSLWMPGTKSLTWMHARGQLFSSDDLLPMIDFEH